MKTLHKNQIFNAFFCSFLDIFIVFLKTAKKKNQKYEY